MKRPLFARAALFAAVIPAGVILAPATASAATDYDSCMTLVESDAAAARRAAIDWFAETGAPAAAHCEAAALSALGAHASAANRLQDAAALPGLPAAARAAMLAQAALIWRDLGEATQALTAIDAAIEQAPSATLQVDRGRILGDLDRAGDARAAFDAALALKPGDPAVMAASAAARMAAGDPIGAQLEAQAALEADGSNPEAWLTLGRAEHELGRPAAARNAWLRAIDLAPETEMAGAARRALQDMDGGG